MIAVKIEGRFGNQLFQYAFAYATAKKLNTNFYLDKTVDYFLLDKYFTTPNPVVGLFDKYIFSIKGYKNIFSHHLRFRFYQLLAKFYNLKFTYVDSCTEPFSQMNTLSDKALYGGFFQSEKYFKSVVNEIVPLFHIKKKYVNQFKAVMTQEHIPAKYVAIHIRRGDYVNENFALSYSYFHDAISAIHSEENFYVFVSDDPEGVAEEFKNYGSKYISNHAEIIDFQFISNAQACIISNSSFSWWAAYLNNNSPKVIAPKNWFGLIDNFETPHSVIPQKFATYQQGFNALNV